MRIVRTAIANLAVIAAGFSLVTVVRPAAWLAWIAALSTGIFLIMALGRKAAGTTRLWWLPLPLATAFASFLILKVAAPSHLFAGFLPTRATWEELGHHLAAAAQTIRFEAAPVPAETGVMFVVLLAVAVVALIVDLFVFQAHTPAFAALPLLALWTPTLILAREVSPVIVLVSFLSWLLLFAAERPWQRQRFVAALHTSWVLGATTAVFLIIALVAVPSLERWGQWRSVAIEKNRTGTGTITDGNPILLADGVVLSHILSERSDQTVVRYRPTGTSPTVLRMKVMSSYANGQWEPATSLQDALEHPAASDAERSEAGVAQVRIQHTGLVEQFGVSPGRVIGMAEDAGAWRVTSDTGELIHTRGNISRAYDVVWDSRSPSRTDLEQTGPARAVDERWTQTPSDLPERFYEELAQARGDATTPYETAVNLQNWFRS
ncbi:MAG TPA: transglutaminaseTgpA domain-containing protein, partial [Actinomycetales bacterium]|nr:transglutaminaseTgpA domain-containing protein [Actinomycetales bacterium]